MGTVQQLDPLQRDLVARLEELTAEAKAGTLAGLYGVAAHRVEEDHALLPVIVGLFGDGAEMMLRLENLRDIVKMNWMDDPDCPWAEILGSVGATEDGTNE